MFDKKNNFIIHNLNLAIAASNGTHHGFCLKKISVRSTPSMGEGHVNTIVFVSSISMYSIIVLETPKTSSPPQSIAVMSIFLYTAFDRFLISASRRGGGNSPAPKNLLVFKISICSGLDSVFFQLIVFLSISRSALIGIRC